MTTSHIPYAETNRFFAFIEVFRVHKASSSNSDSFTFFLQKDKMKRSQRQRRIALAIQTINKTCLYITQCMKCGHKEHKVINN